MSKNKDGGRHRHTVTCISGDKVELKTRTKERITTEGNRPSQAESDEAGEGLGAAATSGSE